MKSRVEIFPDAAFHLIHYTMTLTTLFASAKNVTNLQFGDGFLWKSGVVRPVG